MFLKALQLEVNIGICCHISFGSGYRKGSGNILRHSCFRSHRQKARAKWESCGSLLPRVSTSVCKFFLRNDAQTCRAREEANLERKLRKPVTKEYRKVSSRNTMSQYTKQLDRRSHTYLRCCNDKAKRICENTCLVCWKLCVCFDNVSHATALRFASIPKNLQQGPCRRQLVLHGCIHKCAHMSSYMQPIDR